MKKLQVSCDDRGTPSQIHGLQVEDVLEHWKDTGRWWAGEPEKTFYRILCRDGSVCEIYCEQVQDRLQWYLYKIYD